MIERLIDEINKSLDNECYFAALALALTLPDICGKAQFPTEGNTTRYIKWYNEHIGKYEECPSEWDETHMMPYLSGEVIYNLRNSLLHQGTPGIDSTRIKEAQNKMDKFTLVLEKKNEWNAYMDCASITASSDGTTVRHYSVNVRRLCLILTRTTTGFYNENKSLFNFFTYSIDEEKSKHTFVREEKI